jgi:hypothetical protein
VKLKLVYRLKLSNSVLSAMFRALLPEMKSLPETCRGEVGTVQDSLILDVECSSLSKVRALNNNLIGLVLLLLRIVGELENDRSPTREEPAT